MEFYMPKREQNSNKGTFGKVLNFAGSENYTGAAYLSTLGAYRTGAGYVALCAGKNILERVSVLLPEAVYLNEKEGLKKTGDFDVYLIGCGFGRDFKARRRFRKIIKEIGNTVRPVIIDADGLNILAEMKLSLPENSVITPHPAEAARLLGVKTEDITGDMELSAKRLVKKYNCVAVLKSHRTVICSKEGEIYINSHGNSALAKAGTGDVLAGIIAGLAAQKMPVYEAVKTGVYLHSLAGEIASETLTEYSVLASEIPQYIPFAIKELLNQQT